MSRRRVVLAAVLACVLSGATAAEGRAGSGADLGWAPCGEAPGIECAALTVPADYDKPGGRTIDLHVARSPATSPGERIGTLFVNFGGPGGPVAEVFEAVGAEVFPALNRRFDIIGMDPRGVGQSEDAIDCRVNQETQGLYAHPFATPEFDDLGPFVARGAAYARRCRELNHEILPYASTANVARDMDLLRRALGEQQLTYLGFSYGTFLGATYAALFPERYRAMVLDGAIDPESYMNDPLGDLDVQTAAFERGLDRFFQACAADQATCQGFGGSDPWLAYDRLLERLDRSPVPSYWDDPRPVDGDVARVATAVVIYDKGAWGLLALALAQAQAGDGSILRVLADAFYFALPDGSYLPFLDAYFTLTAVEQRWPRDLGVHVGQGELAWKAHEHFWWNVGYQFPYAFLGIQARDVFRGPWRLPEGAPTTLVIGNRYDPATPYRNARRLAKQLGRARLLTMEGDGHTAYGQSACVDAAVERYLIERVLPPEGTFCPHDVPFAVPAPEEVPTAAGAQRPNPVARLVPGLSR